MYLLAEVTDIKLFWIIHQILEGYTWKEENLEKSKSFLKFLELMKVSS